MTHKPHEYRAIYHWHKSSGSFDYYIKALQRRAAEEGAPIDAIYYQEHERPGWRCMSDLSEGHAFIDCFKKREL